MIKYALICDADHEFESWFPDSASYDKQVKRGLVACPFCQTTKVSKAIMAPNVARKDKDRVLVANDDAALAPAAVAAPAPVQDIALLDEQQQHLRGMIRELHEKLTENSTNVGDNFTQEARKIHAGEAPERSIHGRASMEDAQALIEEGIPVLPLPIPPRDKLQ